MEAPKHTPGPWEVWEFGDPRVVAPGIGWTVFTIERPKPAEEPIHWANARLCAAAPDLHDALSELVWIIDRAGLANLTRGVELGQTSWYVKASDRLEAARAALAKAEGREAPRSSEAAQVLASSPGRPPKSESDHA